MIPRDPAHSFPPNPPVSFNAADETDIQTRFRAGHRCPRGAARLRKSSVRFWRCSGLRSRMSHGHEQHGAGLPDAHSVVRNRLPPELLHASARASDRRAGHTRKASVHIARTLFRTADRCFRIPAGFHRTSPDRSAFRIAAALHPHSELPHLIISLRFCKVSSRMALLMPGGSICNPHS